MKLVLFDDMDKVVSLVNIHPKDITTHVADGGNTMGGISPELRAEIVNLILYGWERRPAAMIGIGIPPIPLPDTLNILERPLAKVLPFKRS